MMAGRSSGNMQFQRLFLSLGALLGAIATIFLAVTIFFAKSPAVGIVLTIVFGLVTAFCVLRLVALRGR
ncbi:MAG: hypothetical protein BGO91_00950 [Leifsonia sp. 71-9]|nr:MAG: hypothetical protein BGO91_00950 [Leifsonia sp. 71-9]